jgi:predicted GIY-YIG superfamily endonuclease
MESTQPIPSRRAAVYRLYDAAGALLYIGSSYDPEKRFRDHHRTAWWPRVRRSEQEWHPSRAKAYEVEAAAIWAERPEYNLKSTLEYALSCQERADRERGKWRVAYDANRMRGDIARQLKRFGYSNDRALAEGMLVERAYKVASGAFPRGVNYPAVADIERLLGASPASSPP